MHERLVTNERDRFSANDLLLAASFNGYRSLGWSDGGHLSKGALADFVTVRTDTVNTAGAAARPDHLRLRASDVSTVVVGGDVVVSDGHHRIGDVGRLLVGAIDRVAGGVAGVSLLLTGIARADDERPGSRRPATPTPATRCSASSATPPSSSPTTAWSSGSGRAAEAPRRRRAPRPRRPRRHPRLRRLAHPPRLRR